MRYQGAGLRLRRAALLAALLFVAPSCALTQQAQTQASPSTTPSGSPSTSPQALAITTAAFRSGEVSVAYAPVTLGATGGATPYTWTISAGALPRGLSLTPDGSVSGTPSAAGTFHFTVKVADNAGVSTTAPKSMRVFAALKLSLIPACALHCSVEIGCVTVCGYFGALRGGSSPYRFAVAGGSLPTGTTLAGLALAGTFGGSPSRAQFTLAVTDALGVTRTLTPTFYIYAHIALLGGSCTGHGSCMVQLGYGGGLPGQTPTVKVVSWVGGKTCAGATCPEPPFAATVGSAFVTINLGPTLIYSTGTFTLSITDQDMCGAGRHCSAIATLIVNLT